jgi:hypothetical protein
MISLEDRSTETKKLHFGPLKDKMSFLTVHQTMSRADAKFYQGCDPFFLAKKATTLFGIWKNIDVFWESSESWGMHVETKGELLNLLATELHAAAFHQTEAMIAFLLCEYQNRPDWVYLTTYANAEMKNAAKAISSGDFASITGDTAKDARAFVKEAVFATWDLSLAEADEAWGQSIDDIAWLLQSVCERFVEGHEYNAYKHGLRVISGSAGLALAPFGSCAFKPIIRMPHAMTYLEISEESAGYVGSEVTKETRPEYSFELIHCMAAVLALTKTMRVARVNGSLDGLEILLPQIDRAGLSRIKPISRFSFPY